MCPPVTSRCDCAQSHAAHLLVTSCPAAENRKVMGTGRGIGMGFTRSEDVDFHDHACDFSSTTIL